MVNDCLATMERKDNENDRADKCSCACQSEDSDNEGSLGWKVFGKPQGVYIGADLLLWFYA